MKIDPRLQGHMPNFQRPTPFTSKDGRLRGWRVTLPGRRPLATPAVVGGQVFIGGGFGGYEFYALNADSGELAWQYQTHDDGPTAAVVWDGHVAFNTESCELEVLTVQGRPVWKKWLGDPLMSMPAISRGKVYMVYPDSRGDRRHCLARFDLYTAKQDWKRPIGGEIITCPVLADGRVYLTTLDGTLWCVRQDDGGLEWQEPKNATSSPVVWNGQSYFSQRQENTRAAAGMQERYQNEHLAATGLKAGSPTRCYRETARAADYLDHMKRMLGSPHFAASAKFDARVGFGAHKGDAKMEQAMCHLGRSHVHAVWAYQGSKPFIADGRVYTALGDAVCCADPKTEEVFWKKTLYEAQAGEELLDHVLTPPAIVNGKLFLGTILGEVCCLEAATGEVLWRVNVGEPVIFQPAVAKGRVYAATGAGSLFALETGDLNDDGWLMWGGGPAHNGVPEQPEQTELPAAQTPPPPPWWRRWKA